MVTAETAANAECHPEVILDLLREQAALYSRLETFARKQRSLVAQEDTGPLLALLADRQKLSTELQRLASRLEPVRRDWMRHHDRLAPAEQREADALLAEVRGRLQRVLESDEQDARVLAGRRQTIDGALKTTHAAGQVASVYRVSASRPAVEQLDEAS